MKLPRNPTVFQAFTDCFPESLWQKLDKNLIFKVERVRNRQRIMLSTHAKYSLGQIVRHRKHPFRGVVFDVDPEFSNTEEWYQAIPEGSRPSKEQPFYHLLAENDQSFYVAYVSEQNLIADYSGEPVEHPDVHDMFGNFDGAAYALHYQMN